MPGTTYQARAIALALAAGLGATAVVGCGQAGAPSRAPAAGPRHAARLEVALRKVAFVPPAVGAAPGDTIVWRNEDLVPHTVTARDGRFASGNLPPDSTFRWVVRGAGSTAYFCSYHPNMHGLVSISGSR